MNMNRRGLLIGASSLLVAAPAIVAFRNLMPVKFMEPFISDPVLAVKWNGPHGSVANGLVESVFNDELKCNGGWSQKMMGMDLYQRASFLNKTVARRDWEAGMETNTLNTLWVVVPRHELTW